jgi:hypothetical protein
MKLPDKIISSAYKEFGLSSNNPWEGTPFEKYYQTGAKQKGALGELIVASFLESEGMIVDKSKNQGHDRIVNNYKTEIKFSCASKRNQDFLFTFNHISFCKDWERIIFCGINGNLEAKIVWFSKENMKELLDESILKHQQAGQENNLDDYCIMGTNSKKLLFHPLAKEMSSF